MSGNRPYADELLRCLRESLATMEQLPAEARRFELKVAMRALDILAREFAQGAAAAAAEQSALTQLLGQQAPLHDLRHELCHALREGRSRHDDPQLLHLLRQSVAARLAIDNPAFSALPGAAP